MKQSKRERLPGIPGCIEHVFSIWEAINFSKQPNKNLYIVWLDLANAYGSVPHALIQAAIDFFWIPEGV